MAFTTNRSNMFYGTTTDINSYVGRQGEISLDIQTNQLRVLDGTTPGGTPLALGNWDLDVTVSGTSPITVTSSQVLVAVTLRATNGAAPADKVVNLPAAPVDGEQHYVNTIIVTQTGATVGKAVVTPLGGNKISGNGTAGYTSLSLAGDGSTPSPTTVNGTVHLVWSASLNRWLILSVAGGITYTP